MGIRNTADDPAVALYDSTMGWAFGPIFDDGVEAEDFLAYCRDVEGAEDLRKVPSARIHEYHERWAEARADKAEEKAR